MGGYLVAGLLFVISIGGAYLVYKMINQMAGGAIGKVISKGVSMAVGAAGGAAGFALRKVGMDRTAEHIGSATKIAQSGASGDIQGALNHSKEAAGNAAKGSLLAKGIKKAHGSDIAQDIGTTTKAVGKSLISGNIVADISSDGSIHKSVSEREVGKASKKSTELGEKKKKRENRLLGAHGGIDKDHLMDLRDNHGLELYKWDESGKMVDGGVFNKDGSMSIDGLSKINEAQTKSNKTDVANIKKVEDEAKSSKRKEKEEGETAKRRVISEGEAAKGRVISEGEAAKRRVISEGEAAKGRVTSEGEAAKGRVSSEEKATSSAINNLPVFEKEVVDLSDNVRKMQQEDGVLGGTMKKMLADSNLSEVHKELKAVSGDWVNANTEDLSKVLQRMPADNGGAKKALEDLIESKGLMSEARERASELRSYIANKQIRMDAVNALNDEKLTAVNALNAEKLTAVNALNAEKLTAVESLNDANLKELASSNDANLKSLAAELGLDHNGSIDKLKDAVVGARIENSKRSFNVLKDFGVEINHQNDSDSDDEIAQVAEAYKKSIERMVAAAAIEEASKKSMADAKKMAEK